MLSTMQPNKTIKQKKRDVWLACGNRRYYRLCATALEKIDWSAKWRLESVPCSTKLDWRFLREDATSSRILAQAVCVHNDALQRFDFELLNKKKILGQQISKDS